MAGMKKRLSWLDLSHGGWGKKTILKCSYKEIVGIGLTPGSSIKFFALKYEK